MGTKVQSKTYFPGSMRDLNSVFCNGSWDVFHENGLSGPGSMQYFDVFLMRQAADGYAKDQMRQMMLKQESIFRHQLQELHRVYKRQRDLMNELATKQGKTSNSSRFRTQIPLGVSDETRFPKGFGVCQRSVIDLEQLADEGEDNDGKHGVGEDNDGKHGVGDVCDPIAERTFNLADLNEPIPAEETSFAANDNRRLLEKLRRRDSSANSSFPSDFPRQSLVERAADCSNLNGVFSYRSNPPQAVPKRAVERRNRTLFGVELCEPPPPSFGGCVVGKRGGTEAPAAHDRRLPPWLVTEPNDTETRVYQMNLHSLQNRSQQFFKKSEVVTKILGVPIVDLPRKGNEEVEDLREAKDLAEKNGVSDFRRHIDLNLSCDEEEAVPPPSPPESASGKISATAVDLEAPPVLEPPTAAAADSPKKPPPKESLLDLDEVAAKSIVSISSSKPVEEHSLLRWFADVITSGDDVGNFPAKDGGKSAVPEGMDDFEFMTLKLEDTKEEYCNYWPKIPAAAEEEAGPPPKRAARKGVGRRGRQRRDFQRDVLPGIVSLSRREVSEDLLTFEDTFNAMGVSWQPKRKALAATRNGRSRRQVVVSIPSPQPPLPPPPPVEESVCREVAVVEKSLGGWGKRTRRLPRQRCSNGGGHYRSLALKC